MGQHKPTIKDVARCAGVSVGTVSNVLNGKREVHSQETAHKVWAAVKALDYRVNLVGRSLVRMRTGMIGVVGEPHNGMATRSLYVTGVLDGVLEYATAHDYQVALITLTRDDVAHARSQIETGSIDGVLVAVPELGGPLLEWMCQRHLPAVSVGSLFPAEHGIACVDVDSDTATYDMVSWLIQIGHRRIGFINGTPRQWSSVVRERAYRRALSDAGLTADPDWYFSREFRVETGRLGVQKMLSVRTPPTALVCGSDLIALGALDQLRSSRIEVPTEMSVIGFDDIPTSQFSQPALTTIRQPLREIGAKAAEILLCQIEDEHQEPHTVFFPGMLIKRQSVAPRT